MPRKKYRNVNRIRLRKVVLVDAAIYDAISDFKESLYIAAVLPEIPDLLLNSITKRERIGDELQKLLGTAGASNLEVSVVEKAAEHVLVQSNCFYLRQYDVERVAANKSCLSEHPFRSDSEL